MHLINKLFFNGRERIMDPNTQQFAATLINVPREREREREVN